MKHPFHLSFLHFRGSDANGMGSGVVKYDEPNNISGRIHNRDPLNNWWSFEVLLKKIWFILGIIICGLVNLKHQVSVFGLRDTKYPLKHET